MSTSARNDARLAVNIRRGCSIALLGLLCGCAVGPRFVRPQPPSTSHYTSGTDPAVTVSANGVVQHLTPGGHLATDWWTLFKSHELDAIVSEALARNPSLDAAQASLRESADELRAGYGIFYPQIDTEDSATRQKFSALRFGQDAPSHLFNLFTLSATVNYAIDLFGGERRAIEGLSAQVELARATRQATYLTLTANIVNTVVAHAAYRAEIDATNEVIRLQTEQVRIAEVQQQAGTVPYSNVLSLRSQLSSVEATVPQLEKKLAQSQDLLATLAGRLPGDGRMPDVSLGDLTLPSNLPITVPSQLVRQRPDILAAEATAHIASANIGVATAALLPNVTLTGNVASDALATNHLFTASGNSWSVGANVAQPLFNGGTLWFRRKAAIDEYERSMDGYRQTVLSAFAQVADTLQALDHDARALRAEQDALSSAEEALRLVQANYEAGLATYLDVLNADGQFHQARVDELQARATRYQDTVALYVAVGGGWNAPEQRGDSP